jgi:sulfite exporter TauE/SafE
MDPKAIATQAADKTIEALTSPQAQSIYKAVITAVVLVAVVIALGLAAAAKHHWAVSVKPQIPVVRQKIQSWLKGARQRIALEYQSWVALVLSLYQGVA